MLSRLKRLEGVIEKLSERNADTTSSTSNVTSPVLGNENVPVNEGHSREDDGGRSRRDDGGCPSARDRPHGRIENELGRLVIEEGRSRYVSSRLWTSLGDEVIFFFFFFIGVVAAD